MITIFGKEKSITWDGSAGAFGAGVRDRLAAIAPEAGIVGLIAPTGLALLEAWQACLDDGRRPIILHFPTAKLSRVYWSDETRRAIASVGIDVLLCADSTCVPDTGIPVILLSDIVPATPRPAVPGGGLDGTGAILQMSSGTTGHRKGIVFTLEAIRLHAAAYNQVLDLMPDDTIVSWLPLYHDMGFVATFLIPRLLGCRLVLMDPMEWVRQPGLLWDAIAAHGGTVCYMPNFGFEIMAGHGCPAPTVRRWISCSEPTRRETMERFMAATGTDASRISNCWGMAENVFAVAQSGTIATRIIDGVEVVGCGRPIPGTEVKAIDGELHVRSAYSLTHYIGGSAITTEDGFYPSGDLGTMIDGEVFLQGRKQDMINHAGRKMLLSDLDFRVGEEVPEAAGRIASFVQFDAGLATEIPVILIEDAEFWQRNRNGEEVRRIAHRTGIETARVHFVPPRFITKTSSGKVNRKKTAEHWAALQAFRLEERDADPGPVTARVATEIRDLFPGLDFDRPLKEQIDSLGSVNLALVFAKHGLRGDLAPTDTVQAMLERQAIPASAADVIKIVSLCDRGPFAGKFSPILGALSQRYDKPVHVKHLCVPPAPILLSDMIFADHFLPRDHRREVYQPLLSVIHDIRSANILIVDDLVHFAWLQASMTYPRISHDFRGDPLAAFLTMRWARYSDGHHQIACELVDGAELQADEANRHLDRLQSYLGVPMIRVAYGNKHPDVTDAWEVQGKGDAFGVATLGQGISISDAAFQAQLLAALDHAVAQAPPRWGEGAPILDLSDQPHWCSWVVNKHTIDFVFDRFDNILVLGKPASVPYLAVEAARRGKRITYRADLRVPDGYDCVLQTGSANKPQTDKPIFQIMGAGWPGEPAANLPDDVLQLCPKSRIWSRHMAHFDV